MSRRGIILLWTALLMTGLVAVACSDTMGENTLVRIVSNPPVVSPKKTSERRTVPGPEALVTSVATPAGTVTAPSGGDDAKKSKKKTEDIVVAAEPVSFVDGETAYGERRYGQAAVLFRRYAERHPDVPWGHFLDGLPSWKDGDLAEAEASFGRALSVAPDHLKSLQNLSRVLIEQGRFGEASDTLRVAVDIDPTSNATYRLLGRVFYAQGKVDEAVDAYRHAIILDDEDGWAMNNLALILIDQRRYDEAVPALARAVTLRDDVPIFHNNLGIALEQGGRFSSAVDAYRSALLVDPAYEKASMNLARVEVVREGPMSTPFDLDVVAQGFVDDLRGWRADALH